MIIADDAGTPSAGATTPAPVALIHGEPLPEFPENLYIPPQALEVFLEAFEGPLDLLLYLIRRQNIDIIDIPIARVTGQYMRYIELMEELQLDLAGEYLLMAATLAEIKSRMLLPRSSETEDEEEDPRADLVKRLQEYKRYQQAAEELDTLPRTGRETFVAIADFPRHARAARQPVVAVDALLKAFAEVLTRAGARSHHHIKRDTLSVRERMTLMLDRVKADGFIEFSSLFAPEEGRGGVIVTFLALLELLKKSLVEAVQNEDNGPIHITAPAR